MEEISDHLSYDVKTIITVYLCRYRAYNSLVTLEYLTGYKIP